VAAVAALVLEVADQKGVTATPELVYDILDRSAKDFKQFGKGYDLDTGHGFIQANKAVGLAEGVFEDLEEDDD
jgi:hypothetical protein